MASIRQAWHEVNPKLLTATIIPTNSIKLSFDFLVNYLFAISARFEIRCKGTAFARESPVQNVPKCTLSGCAGVPACYNLLLIHFCNKQHL